MKSNVPWSVKGIDPEARVVAKEAARKAGMTLGEWMNSMIQQVGTDSPAEKPSGDAATPLPQSGITPDQLRAVVDSLNRLNERLTTTEKQVKRSEETTLEAASGLNLAVETVFERLKRLERERQTGVSHEMIDRVEKLEQSGAEKNRIESLKALEAALTQMVTQFEETRQETLSRVEANESAVTDLASRVDDLDQKMAAGFQEVQDALDAVDKHLEHTERTAKAVILEAQEAAKTTDSEFVERTGKKLQLLGAEIKRSGDQISKVESMVTALTEKIEAAERRSADGIADVSAELDALRQELEDAGLNAEEDEELEGWKEVAREAEAKVASLQASYENMVSRLDHEDPETDLAPSPEKETQPATITPEEKATTSLDEFEELDEIFGNETLVGAAVETPDEKEPSVEKSEDTQEAELLEEEEAPKPTPAREKILAAARARRERLTREREDMAQPDVLDDTIAAHIQSQEESQDHDDSYREDEDRKISLPIVAIIGIAVIGLILLGYNLLTGGDEDSTSTPRIETVAVQDQATPSPTPAAPVEPDGLTLYLEGKDRLETAEIPADFTDAFNLIREAATLGHVPARYRLGELYFSGIGTAQDLQRAKSWFTEAALEGNAASMHRLGTLAVDPSVDGQNFELALQWFERAAEYGVIDSMYNLGYLYDPSSGLLPANLRDASKAFFWYTVAAREGDPIAPGDAANVATTLPASTVQQIRDEVSNWMPKPFDPRVNDGLQIVN